MQRRATNVMKNFQLDIFDKKPVMHVKVLIPWERSHVSLAVKALRTISLSN